MKSEITTHCIECGAELSKKKLNYHAQVCSRECKNARKKKEYLKQYQASTRIYDVCSSTAGTIGELIVSVDLMRRNYQVFRALSPSSSCDLAIAIGNKLLRIEVTTGRRNNSGGISYNKHNQKNYDIIAVVIGTEIVYIGDLPSVSL